MSDDVPGLRRSERREPVWHAESLREHETVGAQLGDGPPEPEAIPGTTTKPPGRRRHRRKDTRVQRIDRNASHWQKDKQSFLSNSGTNTSSNTGKPVSGAPGPKWHQVSCYFVFGLVLAIGSIHRSGFREIGRMFGQGSNWLRSDKISLSPVVLAVLAAMLFVVGLVAARLPRGHSVVPTQVQSIAARALPDSESSGQSTLGSKREATNGVSVGSRIVVANTDGQGLYLRRQPNWTSRWVAWREGTTLQVLATPRRAPSPSPDKAIWLRVRDPDGRIGYVPKQYIAASPEE